MSEKGTGRSKEYSEARNVFDSMKTEEKAVFIVESAVRMLVEGVQRAGDSFSKVFEEMDLEREADCATDADNRKANSSAEGKSSTARKRTSRKKTTSAGAKKTGSASRKKKNV